MAGTAQGSNRGSADAAGAPGFRLDGANWTVLTLAELPSAVGDTVRFACELGGGHVTDGYLAGRGRHPHRPAGGRGPAVTGPVLGC
ncbi:MAG: hypothetical protein M3Y33_17130 [Actinomycetota bacterium]|nr:hypothetical protein [Actinomycetota bacterium]